MAYAIRTKGRHHFIRDVADPLHPKPEEPIYPVGPREWVGFEHLPAGTSESGDSDLEVEAVELEDGKWPDWVTRPESVQAKKERVAAEQAAVNTPAPAPVVEEPFKGRRKAKLSDNAKSAKEDGEE